MLIKSILISDCTTNKTYTSGIIRFYNSSGQVYNVGGYSYTSSDLPNYPYKVKFNGDGNIQIYYSYSYDNGIFGIHNLLSQASGHENDPLYKTGNFSGRGDILIIFNDPIEIDNFSFNPNKDTDNKTMYSCTFTCEFIAGSNQIFSYNLDECDSDNKVQNYTFQLFSYYEGIHSIKTGENKFTNIKNLIKIVPNISFDNELIKFAISFDNKNTWKIFNSNWETLDISDLNLAMEKAMTYEQIKSINYNDYQRIFLSGNIDLLALLKTNELCNKTPCINGYSIFYKKG